MRGAVGTAVFLVALAFGIASRVRPELFRGSTSTAHGGPAAATRPPQFPTVEETLGKLAVGAPPAAPPAGGSDAAPSEIAPVPTPDKSGNQPKPAAVAAGALTPDELFAKASPSVVQVEVRDGDMKPVGQGSGFFVSADGLLVTNHHVIANASFASVRTASGTMLVEGVAASDPGADLALLKVSVKSVPFLKVAEGAAPPVGTRVFAIGNPEGLTNTLSEGLVSGFRTFPGRTEKSPERAFIQTTAAISHGSSGGALLAGNGVVVGVTTAGIDEGQNLNFAVPADAVRRLIGSRGKLRPFASAVAETLSPRDAAAYEGVLTALDHGKFEQAAVLMKGLSERQRNTPAYWFTTGCLHYKLQNFDLAAQAFQEAVRLRPDFSAAYARLGDVYNYQNENDKALATYRKAIQVNPRESRAYCGGGFVYGKQGQFDRAVEIFDRGLAVDPADVELLSRKAIMLGAAKRFAEAEKVYQAALKIDPKRIDTYLYMGETYLKWRKWDKAMKTYRKVITLQPDNAMAYSRLGVAAYNAGDPKTAHSAWQNARRFDPYGPSGGMARQYLQEPKMALLQ